MKVAPANSKECIAGYILPEATKQSSSGQPKFLAEGMEGEESTTKIAWRNRSSPEKSLSFVSKLLRRPCGEQDGPIHNIHPPFTFPWTPR